MSTDISEFLNQQVYPAIIQSPDTAFPEFGFKQTSDGWRATSDYTRSLPGSPNPKRVEIYNNVPFGFTVHGGEFRTWMAELAGGSFPKGKEYVETAKELTKRAGLQFPDSHSSADVAKAEKIERRSTLMEIFLSLCKCSLLGENGKAARDYLTEKRGISPEAINLFDFGYHPAQSVIKKGLVDQGFSQEEIEDSYLLHSPLWEGRVIGVWRDYYGYIINLWARDLTGRCEDHKKYLFLKGGNKKIPFGMDGVHGKDLIVVEGLFDAISLKAKGIDGVIAVGGAALTGDQVKSLVKRGIKTLTLNFDNDQAGIEGTRKAVSLLEKVGVDTFVVDPVTMADPSEPTKKVDPDSYVKLHGLDSYRELLSKKIHSYRFQAKSIISTHKQGSSWSDEGRAKALSEAISFDDKILAPEKQVLVKDCFWSEFHQEGFDQKALDECVGGLREKKVRKQREDDNKKFLRQLSNKMESGDVDASDQLVKERSKTISYQQSTSHKSPILLLSQELGKHDDYIGKFRGREYIGLPQKTLPKIDRAILGLRGLMMFAAMPGVGKTSLAVQMGLDIVANNEEACFLFLSLEMSRQEMITRMICYLARMDWQIYARGSRRGGSLNEALFTREELDRINEARRKLGELSQRIIILDAENFPHPTVESVQAQVEKLKKVTGTSRAYVLVDYLQMWPIPEDRSTKHNTDLENDKYRVAAMKQLSNEDDAVLVITEANKASWEAQGGLESLMGSARVGYSPDVAFVYSPFSDADIVEVFDLAPGEKFAALPQKKKSELAVEIDEKRTYLTNKGVALNMLCIVKGRDGVTRCRIPLAFWYRESRTSEDIEEAVSSPKVRRSFKDDDCW